MADQNRQTLESLPPLPHHPEHSMVWTDLEKRAIAAYAREVLRAQAASLVPDEDGNVMIQTGPNSWIGVSAGKALAARDAFQGKAARAADVEAAQHPTPEPEQAVDARFDVRSILLEVAPGRDGMGVEVYAQTVDDVVRKLTWLGEQVETAALAARQPQAQQGGGEVPAQHQIGEIVRLHARKGTFEVTAVCFRPGKVWYEAGGQFHPSDEVNKPLAALTNKEQRS